MRDYQTLDKLKETVHEMSYSYSDYEMNYEIEKFFEELLTRKRDDPYEGGLQAGGLIYPHKAAFKVNENDGTAVHAHTFEVLAQYMDGEKKFSGTDTLGKISLRRDDPHSWVTIEKYGFEVRFLVGDKSLVIIFETKKEEITEFQLKVINKLINYAKLLYKKGMFQYVHINYVTKQDKFISNDIPLDEDSFEELLSVVNNKRDLNK